MLDMTFGERDIDHATNDRYAYHSVGSTELSARIAKLEPIADRVNELEAALLAHAKSNKDKFDVCVRCTTSPAIMCTHGPSLACPVSQSSFIIVCIQ